MVCHGGGDHIYIHIHIPESDFRDFKGHWFQKFKTVAKLGLGICARAPRARTELSFPLGVWAAGLQSCVGMLA